MICSKVVDAKNAIAFTHKSLKNSANRYMHRDSRLETALQLGQVIPIVRVIWVTSLSGLKWVLPGHTNMRDPHQKYLVIVYQKLQ